nr:diaminopimelate decarboxylase [Maliibacterium massiliense]
MQVEMTYQRARQLLAQYDSPLYVYDEAVLRDRCRQMTQLLPNHNFRVLYSAKANTNLTLLRIIREEGLRVDAMSPGEMCIERASGFDISDIFYVCNNISRQEMQRAIREGVLISVDSLSQLETYGQLNPGGRVAIRFNPEVGAGHSEKVVTGGKHTKFGVQIAQIDQVRALLDRYNLRLVGINQHIGSLFMDGKPFVEGVRHLLEVARQFPGLEVIDMGGGFGVPYREGEGRLDLAALSAALAETLDAFLAGYDNKDVTFQIEPGRYIVAECGVLLGGVHAVKESYDVTYVGTDIGFNVLARPMLYDAYHAMEVLHEGARGRQRATVVGNICESGDILARDRELDEARVGDILLVRNAGAYGYAMASQYNCRLRPAEVLLDMLGKDRLIRRRDDYAGLLAQFV